MFVILNVEFCQEASGTDRDKGRTIGVRPEDGRELVEYILLEVMRDDKGEGADPVVSMLSRQEIIDIFEDSLALDGFVELAEERNGFLGTRLANAVLGVQEKVVSSIRRGSDGSIKDGEVTDAGEDEVLEDGGGCG